jgi:Kef-type K+ transport system membrane component KefB
VARIWGYHILNLADTTQLLAKPKLALTYAGLVGGPLAALVVVLRLGRGLSLAPPLSGSHNTNATPALAVGFPDLALLMAQIGLIILLSRAVGSLIERIGQPRVIGEVLSGLLLGPSFLGWVAPGLSASLFPTQSLGVLNALSQVGLVFFMFMVGLELNLNEVHRQGRVAILISHASIVAPLALGAMLALYLYPRLSDATVSFSEFALFMGVAMSITAFPVLARILSERKLLRSRLGTMAIACAAVGDVTGWCVLAYVVGLARATHSSLPLWETIAGVAIFLLVMFGGVKIFLRKIERAYLAHGELSDNWKAFLLLLLLMSSLITEGLGLHLVFGAFIAGAVMPRNRDFASYVIDRFESLTVLLLLPLFFAYTGLRTSIGQVKGLGMWWLCLIIIVAAVAGKLGGTSIAARAGGMRWRESLALGALMNTRGLMELIVLNIGLDIKVISPALFSMMVIMAIVTTMMTPPLLEWVYPASRAHPLSRPGR